MRNETQHKISSRLKKKEQTIWQRRFWKHLIRDDQDLIRHFGYRNSSEPHPKVERGFTGKGNEMAQFVAETSIKHGQLALDKIPFKDNTKVKVVLIPKVELSQMSFEKAQELTRKIKGNLSNDISKEKD